VLDKGRIVGEGNYSELINTNKEFKRMANANL
jgi:ABC-type multidrug transport system fused ATPase/permease subunit